MKITSQVVALITDAMRKKSMSQADLAKSINHGKPWASKLLKMEMKTLAEDDVDKLETILGISFLSIKDTPSPSGVAQLLSSRADENPDLAELLVRLANITETNLFHQIPYLPTKDLVEFGKEITRASHEDPDKPGKVGRVAIVWLSGRLKELEKSNN